MTSSRFACVALCIIAAACGGRPLEPGVNAPTPSDLVSSPSVEGVACVSGEWTTTTMNAAPTGVGDGPLALAISPSGTSYALLVTSDSVRVATIDRAGPSQATTIDALPSGSSAAAGTIVRDSHGELHAVYVVYRAASNVDQYDAALRYAHGFGTSWIVTDLTPPGWVSPIFGPYRTTALVIDDSDGLHVIYNDCAGALRELSRSADGTWSALDISPPPRSSHLGLTAGTGLDLLFRAPATGALHEAHRALDGLWQADPGPAPALALCAPAYDVEPVALDPLQGLHVAYPCLPDREPVTFLYGYRPLGRNWQFSNDAPPDIHSVSGIAASSTAVHLTMTMSMSPGGLGYAHRSSITNPWQVETVGDHSSGMEAPIAVDDAGGVHVVYEAYSNRLIQLRHAYRCP